MTAKELELERLRAKGAELQRVRQLFFATYIRDNQKRLEANFGNRDDVCVRLETLRSELMWAYEGGYAAARADLTKAQAERDALKEQLEQTEADRGELRSVFGAAQHYYHAVYGRPPIMELEDAENAVLKAVEGYLDTLAQHRGEADRGEG